MKRVKYVISGFIMLLCFLLSSVLFQEHATSFFTGYNGFSLNGNYSPEEQQIVLDKIEQNLKQKGGTLFAVDLFVADQTYTHVTVYATDQAEKMLYEKSGIRPGVYRSITVGRTEIEFCDFSEAVKDSYLTNFYYICPGNESVIEEILKRVYGCSCTSSKWSLNTIIPLVIWGLGFFFFLFLTTMDIQFQKKRNFLLLSLGQSEKSLILRNILLDTPILAGLFAAEFFLLKPFVYVEHQILPVVWMLVGFLFINVAVYLSMLVYNYKEVLYGANLNANTLSNCYLLKAVVSIVTLISFVVNFSAAMQLLPFMGDYKTIQQAGNWGHLSVSTVITDEADVYEDKTQNQVSVELVARFLREDKAALCCLVAYTLEDRPVVLINKNGLAYVDRPERLKISEDKELCILIPDQAKNEDVASIVEEAVQSGTRAFVSGEQALSYEVAEYSTTYALLPSEEGIGVMSGRMIGLGFERVYDPIFIYCNLSADTFDRMEHIEGDDVFFRIKSEDILLALNEEDQRKIQTDARVNKVYFETFRESCEQYQTVARRILLLNSVISLSLLLLGVLLVVTILRLEFIIHAKELAVKKMLGYSLLQRNKTVFFLNLFASVIGLITVSVATLMFDLGQLSTVLILFGGLCVAEQLLIIWCVIHLERKRVPHILKGGSL